MLKKQGNISTSLSPIDSLKFSTFNYFGLGAVLASVAQSFWINFSAYYLNNILPSYGNTIFLVAQLFEGFGILLGWFILAKVGSKLKGLHEQKKDVSNKTCISRWLDGINLYMLVYITGAILLIVCLPLVFLLTLSSPPLVFTFAILAKIGSGLMIISQLTIIPKITLNRSRRVLIYYLQQRKLVQKVTQYGLAGTFISMFVMTIVSTYVNFVWKYFFGVCVFVVLGGICSLMYAYKIRELVMSSSEALAKERFSSSSSDCKQKQNQSQGLVQWSILKSPKFYIYGIVLILCSLYMDVVIAIYPYFIKSFHNISHFRYLSAITALYLSSFVCSLLTKNAFVFSSIRSTMTVGFISCVFATFLLVIGLIDRQFDSLMVVGTCLTGVSKVIAMNCALNIINQFIGKQVRGREFVYGFYYFLEKIVNGFALYCLIKKVYLSEDVEFLHFSEIYLPFILYSLSWILVVVERTLTQKLNKNQHIVIVEPDQTAKNSIQLDAHKILGIKPINIAINEEISPKIKAKYQNWAAKESKASS